jgi:hypothetical protein
MVGTGFDTCGCHSACSELHLANFTFIGGHYFIFIPVLGSLSTAWEAARRTGRFSPAVAGSLGSAFVVGTVGTMLLFGLDWGRLWPLMIIAPGLSGFLSGIAGVDPEKSKNGSIWLSLSAWVGLAMIFLGIGFLANFYPIPVLQPFITGYRWWAIAIMIPGVGAVIGAIYSSFAMTENDLVRLVDAADRGFTLATGIVALLGLDWNLFSLWFLIACGVVVLAGLLKK